LPDFDSFFLGLLRGFDKKERESKSESESESESERERERGGKRLCVKDRTNECRIEKEHGAVKGLLLYS
jgi:hypothetical protein